MRYLKNLVFDILMEFEYIINNMLQNNTVSIENLMSLEVCRIPKAEFL